MKPLRISLIASLLISTASYIYIYLAPEGFHPLVILGAPVAVIVLGLSARLYSSRQNSLPPSRKA